MLNYYLASGLPQNFSESWIEQRNTSHTCPIPLRVVPVSFHHVIHVYTCILSLSVYRYCIVIVIVAYMCDYCRLLYLAARLLLIQQAVRKAATICPAPCKFTFDLLTLKVVSESCVTWATSVPIFGLPRPLCSRLRSDVRDRLTDVRRALSLNAPRP